MHIKTLYYINQSPQGLVGAIFEGVGVSLGSLLAGHLFQKIGGSKTFRLFGISALVLFVAHVLIQFTVDRFGKRGKHDEEKVANDRILNHPTCPGDGDNDIVEKGGSFDKNGSVLSDSTVQEEFAYEQPQEVLEQDINEVEAKSTEENNGLQNIHLTKKI